MKTKTNEMVTINDAMVNAIAQAVTLAVTSALQSVATPETPEIESPKAKSPKTESPKTSAKASKKPVSEMTESELKTSGLVGYIETNAGRIYIARIDGAKNQWIAKTDKKGALVYDKKGKIESLYDDNKYQDAKAKAVKKGTYKRDKSGFTNSRKAIYKSLKWVAVGKVVKF